MPRKYEKVLSLLPEVKRMVEEGYTQREIAEQLELSSKRVVKSLLERQRKKDCQGVRKQRGRKPPKTLQEYTSENQRLKMEVELLGVFLSLTEKK